MITPQVPYPYEAPCSQALLTRATAVTPGGVNSPVRAFRAVGGTPRFMASGRGPYLIDVDGVEYVDLVCSWGPMILGHAHPAVVEAVGAAARRGTSFGTPTAGEVELAVERACEETGNAIACVIVEAAAANMGVVPPHPGFNAGLRALCDSYGALLVIDEVMTGFRVSRSGWFGLEGVAADLVTLGKVMGGGLPAAAFGGRAEVMARLAPAGPVYQAGTLSGNPVAVAAGLTTLRHCTDEVYRHVDATALAVSGLVVDALTSAGVAHRCNAAGSLFSVFFAGHAVVDYATATRQSVERYRAFFHAMLAGGVYTPPANIAWK